MPKTGIRPYETKTRGRQWLAYYRRDGKQVNKRGFRTARTAERWRADAMLNAASPAESRITVGEWVTEWLERHGSRIKESSHRRYARVLRVWILPHLGRLRLVQLTHRHIEAMHNAAIKAGRSPKTLRLNHAPLRLALEDAVRAGIIADNPARLARLPRTEKKEMQIFSPIEAQAFLLANREHEFYPIYHLALSSGLRISELLALRVGRDIDLSAGVLIVREGRDSGHNLNTPKSERSRRVVVLPPVAVSVLGKAIKDVPDGQLAFSYKYDTVSRSMAGACARAVVKRIRFHDLRHTHASMLLASGANVKAVSARIGHASASMTLDVYGHVMPGEDEELAEMSAALLPSDTKILRRDATRLLSPTVSETSSTAY